jgi:hypothetical protein
MEDAFTHPWRVFWYQESRSFIWKMCLLNNGKFTVIRSPGVSYRRCINSYSGKLSGIRSPEVSYGQCVYSSMERLLVSGVLKFHKEDTFTRPWRVYWYHESRSFLWKMRLIIPREITNIMSPKVRVY